MNKKSFCIITDSFLLDETSHINGTQVQCYMLAKALSDRGYDVHYIARTGSDKAGTKTLESGIHLHWLSKSKQKYARIYQSHSEYYELLDEIAPDVVYNRGRSHLTCVAASYAKRHGKTFIWGSNGENGCEPFKYLPSLWHSRKPIWKKILLSPFTLWEDLRLRKGIRLADQVVNQSVIQKNDLKKYFNNEGIILKSLHPRPESIVKNTAPRTVLWIASLAPGKQPELFVTIAKACADYKDWNFQMVGGSKDSSYYERIKKSCEDAGIDFVGAVPFEETGQYFSQASLFINTSRFDSEGLPNTFVQALLSETPICSLNIDPDQAIQSNKMGIIADGDLGVLIDKLKNVLDDEKILAGYVENSKAYAARTFDIDHIIDAYEKIIER